MENGQRTPKVGFPRAEGTSLLWDPGSLNMHFLHSGAQISVFEHNTNIIKFWLLCSERVHK